MMLPAGLGRRGHIMTPHASTSRRPTWARASASCCSTRSTPNWIAPLGPHVDAFEREFAAAVGVPHAVALSSGTAALHLALEILGVGRGDEVLTSTLTFAATANAITYVGAAPVFIDVSRETWNLDPDLLEQELASSRARRHGRRRRC